MESSGENRILISPGANAQVLPDVLPVDLFRPSAAESISLIIMQLEIPLETVVYMSSEARELNIPVLLNPAPAIPLPESIYADIDILVVNESEAALLSGVVFPDPPDLRPSSDIDRTIPTQSDYIGRAHDAASWFSSRGCPNVIVTLGALGAVWYHRSEKSGYVEAAKAEPNVLDTTAAGDTFVGALSIFLVRKRITKRGNELNGSQMLEEAVRFAAKAAAWTVARKGTWNAMPKGDDLS